MKNTKDVVEMMMAMMDTADKGSFKGLFDVMLELGIGEEDEPNKVAKPVKLLPPGSVKVEKAVAPEYIKDKSRKDRIRNDAFHRTKDCGGKKNDRVRKDYKDESAYNNDRRAYNKFNKGGEMDKDNLGYVNDTAKNRRYIQKMDALENTASDDALAQQDVLDYLRLVEAKKSYEDTYNRMKKECEELQKLHEKLKDVLAEEVKKSDVDFVYTPYIDLESYAFDALDNAEDAIERITARLERYF